MYLLILCRGVPQGSFLGPSSLTLNTVINDAILGVDLPAGVKFFADDLGIIQRPSGVPNSGWQELRRKTKTINIEKNIDLARARSRDKHISCKLI